MYYLILILPFLVACSAVPELAKDIESIATDTGIKIEVSRETIQKDSDLGINVNIHNKDETTIKTAPGSTRSIK